MNESNREKTVLRAELRRRLTAVDPDRLRRASHTAAVNLIATDAFRRARAVMLFLPLKYEIDARPIALRAWQEGKTVTVPLVGYAQKHMIPVVAASLDEPMAEDRYGVSTPRGGEPFPVEMIDLVIVPGLGFDREGRRLGRGGGFYDRFLAQSTFSGTVCGLALAEQMIDKVPTLAHDVRLDMLVTDAEVLQFAAASV